MIDFPHGDGVSATRRRFLFAAEYRMDTLLSPSDVHYLKAALGWVELGNLDEAQEELAWIDAASQHHPAVLEVRWQLEAHRQQWETALAVAEELFQAAPDRVSSWVHRAYSLRRAKSGGLGAAHEALLPAVEKFPNELIVPYNLACYVAQLGQLEAAWEWLLRATKVSDAATILKMALADPDLEPLWDRLKKSRLS